MSETFGHVPRRYRELIGGAPLPQEMKKSQKIVIFVLGKPGSGKGTVCKELCKQRNGMPISAGQALRDEANDPNSPDAAEILDNMNHGIIVQPKITVRLLQKIVNKHPEVDFYLIDGFPREMPQLEYILNNNIFSEYEKYMLCLNCPNDICRQRIHHRNAGRSDDTDAVIDTRFNNFQNETQHVIERFRLEKRLFEVDSNRPEELVAKDALAVVDRLLQY